MNARQQRFVQEYLIDLNSTQAAIRAGYKSENANVTGPRLLANVGIREEIAKAQNKRAAKVELTQEFIINALLENLAGGQEDGDRSAVNRTCELLGKHKGMFIDRHEITGKDGEPLTVKVLAGFDPEKFKSSQQQHKLNSIPQPALTLLTEQPGNSSSEETRKCS